MPFETVHPLVVHFPIALLIVVLLLDLAAFAFPRAELARASLYVSTLATLGAAAAYLTGGVAEEAAERLPGIEPLLERHEDLGKVVLILAIVALGVRLACFWRGWQDLFAGRVALALLSAPLAVVVGFSGHTGGQLVYDHGAGVAPVMQQLPAADRSDQD